MNHDYETTIKSIAQDDYDDGVQTLVVTYLDKHTETFKRVWPDSESHEKFMDGVNLKELKRAKALYLFNDITKLTKPLTDADKATLDAVSSKLSLKEKRAAKKQLRSLMAELQKEGLKLKEKRKIKKELKAQILVLGGSLASNNSKNNTVENSADKFHEELKEAVASNDTNNNADSSIPSESSNVSEAIEEERIPTIDLYPDEVQLSASKRGLANRTAVNLLDKINSGEIDKTALTNEEKKTLAAYSGNGGGLKGVDGKIGSPYEYYTPKPIAEATWGLLVAAGFKGGNVLDPSSGTGIFGGTSPTNAIVDAVELDSTSGGINDALNGGNGKVTISSFEETAANTPDEVYDAVITNIPFGDNSKRGANKLKDDKYQKETLEGYFILRSLDKLKPNGIAAFISSSSFIQGKNYEKLRTMSSFKAEFVGAYRLPNAQDTGEKTKKGNAKELSTFAGADVTSDVLVFRKHSRDALDKIEALKQADVTVLIEANVLYQPFIKGKYFKEAENKKRILGEVTTGMGQYGEVQRVVSDDSIANVSKLMKRLPDSRINWEMIDAEEGSPITYREGDIKYIDGQAYTFRNNDFVKGNADTSLGFDPELNTSVSDLETPLHAIQSKATYDSVKTIYDALQEKDMHNDIPLWLRFVVGSMTKGRSKDNGAFQYIITSLATELVFKEHSANLPFNFSEEYPQLSTAIKSYSNKKKIMPKMVDQSIKNASSMMQSIHSRKYGFSNVWLGAGSEGLDDVVVVSTHKFENIKYNKSDKKGFVPIDLFIEEMGIDPLEDEEWCLSADGQGVKHANDYYLGNYDDFIKEHEGAIESASGDVKAKLVSQMSEAEDRLIKVDTKALTFDLFSPFVSVKRKVEFLNKYVPDRGAGSFSTSYDEKGQPIIVYTESMAGKAGARDEKEFTERKRNLRRFTQYITKRTFTTGSSELERKQEPKIEQQRIERLKTLTTNMNQQFDSWTRANSAIQQDIEERFNDPKNMYFEEASDGSPLDIPNINPKLTPHDYQNTAIRGYARNMKGIMGYDVGLGKTNVGLLTAEYLQSRRIKKKTLFVVPNKTLTNWKKETKLWYQDTSSCLFVGLTEDDKGNSKIQSSNYGRDMLTILEGNHSKVFMTLSAFEMIPLRDNTLEGYISYIKTVDNSFDSLGEENKTKAIKKEGLAAEIVGGNKNASFPFFEDMKFDSLILDEGHMYKNSKQVIEFKGAKQLSTAPPSGRGKDAQVKAWHIRGLSSKKDGVLPLTATPITNSPLEMYSMLSLAVGEDELNRRLGGIRGADDFMEAFCRVDETTAVNLVGDEVLTRVFTGLKNVPMLRNILHGTANIKNAKDVNLRIPKYEDNKVSIALPEPIITELTSLKAIYSIARIDESENEDITPDQRVILDAYKAATGETSALIAHPFNLINKMNKIIIDQDLARQSTVYFTLEEEKDKAQEAVDEFNAITVTSNKQTFPLNELRPHGRKTPTQKEDAVIGQVIEKDEYGDEITYDRVHIKAYLVDDKIVLDTESFEVQNRFLAIAKRLGLSLDVSVSPKMAALVENISIENSKPKSPKDKPTMAKQIIFCDMLGIHNKLKILIAEKCGIPSSKIFILNGKSVKDPADMQDVQDGFNAEGDSNAYEVIIANKVAEVGINLQKGTQAIHHLTIGWTPDSLQQRNGRGVRQGNYVESINVYHYDADGTFDEYKRDLVGVKADWIGNLIAGDENGDITVTGSLSKEDADDLIGSMGSAENVRRVRERQQVREELARKKANKDRVISNLSVIKTQIKALDKYEGNFNVFLQERVTEVGNALKLVESAERAVETQEAKDPDAEAKKDRPNLNAIRKNKAAIKGGEKVLNRLSKEIDKAIKLTITEGRGVDSVTKDAGIIGLLKTSRYRNKNGILKMNDVDDLIRYSSYGDSPAEIVEDSSIKTDWIVEIETAKKLLEESSLKAKEMSAGAGIDESRVDAYIAGEGDVVRGNIISVGDFVMDNETNDIYCFNSIDRNKGEHGLFSLDNEGREKSGSGSLALTGKVINKESMDYKNTVAKVVAIDNAIIESKGGIETSISMYGSLSTSATLYSQYNSDVLAGIVDPYKDQYVISEYSIRKVILEDEYFPVILDKDKPSNSELIVSILAKQKAVVTFENDKAYINKSAVNSFVSTFGSSTTPDAVKLLIDYAKTNSLKVSANDYDPVGASEHGFVSSVLKKMSAKTPESTIDFDTIFDDQKTESEVYEAATAFTLEQYPNFDFSSLDMESFDYSHASWSLSRSISSRIAAIAEEEKKEALGAIKKDIDNMDAVITSSTEFPFPHYANINNIDNYVGVMFEGDSAPNDYYASGKFSYVSISNSDENALRALKFYIAKGAKRVIFADKEKMQDIAYNRLSSSEKEDYEGIPDAKGKINYLSTRGNIEGIKSKDILGTVNVEKVDLEDPLEWVAIIGNTYRFKDEIKKVAKEVGDKDQSDDYASFSKQPISRKRYPNPPENSWIVSRRVYNAILEKYPDEVNDNNISIA